MASAARSAHQEFFALAAYEEQDTPWDIAAPQPRMETALRARAFSQLKARTAVDLGCGFGHHTRLLAELGCEAVGLDVSHAAISSAQSRSREWVKRAGNTTSPQFMQADLLDSAAVGAAVGRRTFDVLLDAATFHCFDDEERGNYLQTLERLSHVGSHLLFLNFSDATEGTGGSLPRRLTKDEVLTAFCETCGWRVLTIEPSRYLHGFVASDGGIQTTSDDAAPNAWLALIARHQ